MQQSGIQIQATEIILFVENQEESTRFYSNLFGFEPCLFVSGMSEFNLGNGIKLGLMPNDGIHRLLQPTIQHPKNANGAPTCELYLLVDDVKAIYAHANQIGAKEISPILKRSWGDIACYFQDPDGHLIAFAERKK